MINFISKTRYLELKAQKLSDEDVAKIMHISRRTLSTWKSKQDFSVVEVDNQPPPSPKPLTEAVGKLLASKVVEAQQNTPIEAKDLENRTKDFILKTLTKDWIDEKAQAHLCATILTLTLGGKK